MTSPNSSVSSSERVQKPPKRAVNIVIPALPLVPGSKKPSKHEARPVESEIGPEDQTSTGPTEHEKTTPKQVELAQAGQYRTDSASFMEDGPNPAYDAADVPALEQHVIANEDTTHGGSEAVSEQMATVETNPSEVEGTVAIADVTAQAETTNGKSESDPIPTDANRYRKEVLAEGTQQPLTSSVELPVRPLIIDSSFGQQNRESLIFQAYDSDPMTSQPYDNTNSSSQVVREADDSVPTIANVTNDRNAIEQTHFSAHPSAFNSDFSLQGQGRWPFEQSDQVQPYVTSMHPPPLVTSGFSAAAPVFTPASGTPPYSLSSTPVMPSTGDTPTAEYGLQNGFPSGQGVLQMTSFHPPFNQQRRQLKQRQAVSHAHGEMRSANNQQHYQGNGHTGHLSPNMLADGLFAPLLTHLTSIFDSAMYADWKIIIHSPDKSFEPLCLAVHGAVISRNMALNHYMMEAQRNRKATNEIYIPWPDTFIHPSSFTAAVRFIYNDMLLTKEEAERTTYPGDSGPSWSHLQLHCSLSYYLSGYTLGLGAIMRQGRELVNAFLDWDTLETAMNWAIDYRSKSFGDAADTMGVQMGRTSSGLSHHSQQTSSSRSSFPLKTSPTGQPLVISPAASNLLLDLVVQFLAHNVSFESFVVDANARPTEMKSRLPITKEIAVSQRPTPNTALHAISFGEFRGIGSQGSSVQDNTYRNYVASVAFLNLPFDTLNGLLIVLQRHNDPRAYEFAKQIIADRENLRIQVLRSKSVNPHEREDNMAEWQEAGFQEYINDAAPGMAQNGGPGGHRWRLERVWVGVKNPAGSSKKPRYAKKREQSFDGFHQEQQDGQAQNLQSTAAH